MAKLSATQIRNAKPQAKPYKLPDGQGLYLHVSESGLKTWRYRFRVNGKETTFTLGEYPQMTLEQARSTRISTRATVKAGVNPADIRRQDKQEKIEQQLSVKKVFLNSFKTVALEWVDLQRTRWSKDHADSVLNTFINEAFPVIGDTAVDTIPPPVILDIIRAIENRGAQEMARKTLQRITAVFRYAIQTGRATYNPASEMKGALKPKETRHMPAISTDELPQFLQRLATADIHTTTRLALQFLILTASRTTEVRGATWEEIDLDTNLWHIPAARMKMNVPHTVPLSRQAVAILRRVSILYGQGGLVFPGIRQESKQLSENTLLYAMYRLGYHSQATVHGFRATFSTIANESGFNPDVIERALAHKEKNLVRAAYHRSEYLEQRRELMQWWADYLDRQALNNTSKIPINHGEAR